MQLGVLFWFLLGHSNYMLGFDLDQLVQVMLGMFNKNGLKMLLGGKRKQNSTHEFLPRKILIYKIKKII